MDYLRIIYVLVTADCILREMIHRKHIGHIGLLCKNNNLENHNFYDDKYQFGVPLMYM